MDTDQNEEPEQDCRSADVVSNNVKKAAKRKYHESYIEMGFAETSDNKPQYVICGKVLPNSSMVPVKMRRHFEGKHAEYDGKPTDFFKRKHEELSKAQQILTDRCKTANEKAVLASYLVSYRVAKAGEAHTIAETLIKPCVEDIVKVMVDDKTAGVVNSIPMSDNTVSRRIYDMAEDVENSLISRLKISKFAIQLDESTDVAGLAILMVFVRYSMFESFEEDLLLCKPLPTTTTGAEIFKLIDDYFTENSIPWDNCVDVCSDGAKAMVGKTAGAVSRIKEKARACDSSHCILHRHALAMKKMSAPLKEVLDESVKIINFIKSRPKNSRLFKALCDEMGSQHSTLLLHTEVRWLSRGKALSRLFDLREEVRKFLIDSDFALGHKLSDEKWLTKLAYLADIFLKMNELSVSMQGKAVTIFDTNVKILAFKRKIKFWAESMEKENIESFPNLNKIKSEISLEISSTDYQEFHIHLKDLMDSFQQYFPKEYHSKIEEQAWVEQPFAVSEKPASLTSHQYECLIDLTSDSKIKEKFESKKSLEEFWCQLKNEFQVLSDKAKLILLPFATTYLCESGFSIYLATKTKYRSRLNAEPDVRLQLSQIKPNIEQLAKSKRAHLFN